MLSSTVDYPLTAAGTWAPVSVPKRRNRSKSQKNVSRAQHESHTPQNNELRFFCPFCFCAELLEILEEFFRSILPEFLNELSGEVVGGAL